MIILYIYLKLILKLLMQIIFFKLLDGRIETETQTHLKCKIVPQSVLRITNNSI